MYVGIDFDYFSNSRNIGERPETGKNFCIMVLSRLMTMLVILRKISVNKFGIRYKEYNVRQS